MIMTSTKDKVTEAVFARFPADKLDDARAELTKAHARLVRAAARTGQEAPAAPELVVLREYVVSRCSRHGQEFEGTSDRCRGPVVVRKTNSEIVASTMPMAAA